MERHRESCRSVFAWGTADNTFRRVGRRGDHLCFDSFDVLSCAFALTVPDGKAEVRETGHVFVFVGLEIAVDADCIESNIRSWRSADMVNRNVLVVASFQIALDGDICAVAIPDENVEFLVDNSIQRGNSVGRKKMDGA